MKNKLFLLSSLAVAIGFAFPIYAQADTLMVENSSLSSGACGLSSDIVVDRPVLLEKTISTPVVVEKTVSQPVLLNQVMERPIIIREKPRRHLLNFTLF